MNSGIIYISNSKEHVILIGRKVLLLQNNEQLLAFRLLGVARVCLSL
jgi:hypothetical protein